jgi:DNA invertase Pin-like site-specific DNA recombinase
MATRVLGYARFSTDLQDERSIADQERLCQELAKRTAPDAAPSRNFSDAAVSGASMMGRPGLRALLRAVQAGEADLVVTEHLDRLSRRLADAAAIYDQLKFAGVRLVTVAQGEIDEMKIAFMGLQSELFLKDLRQKTHRGLRGQVERGKSAGGRSYGYRSVRGEPGVLEVHPKEAPIVHRIFEAFAKGVSAKVIAKSLNAEGIVGPGGSAWSPSTIHGHSGRGTGVLNNELYVGKRVWNRQRFLKDPNTGKRVARPNPASEWIIKDVPNLRIIDDHLWQAVKQRQAAIRHSMQAGIVRARRPKYLFSKLTRCGTCGGGYILSSRDTLRCFNHSARGTCTNSRTITRKDVEARVLRAMQLRFFEGDAFDEFCRAFTEETNRLRREHRAKLAAVPREIAGIDRRSKEILELMLQGFRDEAWKDELKTLDARRTELKATLAAAEKAPASPVFHPKMAVVFRQKTMQLAAALEHEDEEQREVAREALRGFIDRIVIPPGEGLLQVVGNFGEMLAAAAGRDGATVAYVGCGGVQPAVLAAVERGGVSTAEWPELTNCRQRADETPPHRGVARAPPIIPTAMGSSAVSSAGRRRGTPRTLSQTSARAWVLRTQGRRRGRRARAPRRRR